MNYCWAGDVTDFLNTPYEFWLQEMSQNFDVMTKQRPSQQQVTAWQGSFEVLQRALKEVTEVDEGAKDWTLVFEYELPREGGRRPDVVLLARGQVIVLEFKEKAGLHAADVDQVAAYARDLANYHGASHGRLTIPVLIPTQRETSEEVREVQVVAPRSLAGWLQGLQTSTNSPIDADAWLSADYAPLPSVIQAARHIFQNEPLPSVRRAQSAGIPEVMTYLSEIVERAQRCGERHLVLVTGVPGAGKTLVGLQFVIKPTMMRKRRTPCSSPGMDLSCRYYSTRSKVVPSCSRSATFSSNTPSKIRVPRPNISSSLTRPNARGIGSA